MQDMGKREYMNDAYLVLPHILMCIWSAYKDKDIISILGTILGIFLLLSFGNRGSMVDIIFFVLVYVLLFIKAKHKYVIYALAIAIGGVLYYYMDVILLFFQGLLSELGMSTRIFDLLIDNSFLSGSSVDERDLFLSKLMTAIKEGPWFGYGFCGSWQFIGSYPHNLFFDLAITFGPVFGSMIMICLVLLIFRAYRATSNKDERVFLLILVTTGFVKLFISYTFLDNIETFLMIGYCLCLIRKNRSHTYLSIYERKNKKLLS